MIMKLINRKVRPAMKGIDVLAVGEGIKIHDDTPIINPVIPPLILLIDSAAFHPIFILIFPIFLVISLIFSILKKKK